MSQTIVTAFTGTEVSSPDVEPNTEPLPHSNTKNVHTCYLCERPAQHVYETMAFTWLGRDWPSEKRHLCDVHNGNACALIVESVDIRDTVERSFEAAIKRGAA